MKSAFVWLVSLLLIWAVGMVQAQTVYQWTDENGVRHFSNTGPPSDAENVDTQTEKITPPQIEAEAEQEAAADQDESLEQAPEPKASPPTVRERAEQIRQASVAQQAEEERRRLEAEISQVEGRSLSRTFTEGMRAARLEPLIQQLSLLDSDPERYFEMKQDGAFSTGGRSSSNRDRRGGRTGVDRDRGPY